MVFVAQQQNVMHGLENTKKHLSRPCDACAVRRVRCDLQQQESGTCTNCTNHAIQCTNVRIRRKSGPKKLRQKTKDNIGSLVSTSTLFLEAGGTFNPDVKIYSPIPHLMSPKSRTFSVNQLLPYLQVYQMWFYPIWPILPTMRVIENIQANGTPLTFDLPLQLNDDNIRHFYVLSCAVCAAVARHKDFLKSLDGVLSLNNCFEPHEYIQEARRVIFEYELTMNPSVNLLLTSYFMHIYYDNILGETNRGLMYIREAVSLAHILGLHEQSTYELKSKAESHHLRKIYYQILITERFIAFESNLPVLLEPNLEIPSLEDDEYSDLLLGFTELARMFSAIDKDFFKELHKNKTHRREAFQDIFTSKQSKETKKLWMYQLQKKLDMKIQSDRIARDAQKVNIALSKAWFQSLGWMISSENQFLTSTGQQDPSHYFSYKFPLEIAKDFLTATNGFPDYAFESNGPGAALKMLEIADALYTYNVGPMGRTDSGSGLDQLNHIFNMVVRLKNDMELPKTVFSKISTLLESKRFSNQRSIDLSSISFIPNHFSSEGNLVPKIEEIMGFDGSPYTYTTPEATSSRFVEYMDGSFDGLDLFQHRLNQEARTPDFGPLARTKSPSGLFLFKMQDSLNCLSPFFMTTANNR